MQSTLVYDDDCGFCTRSARFVARHSSVVIVGFSEMTPALRERLPPTYRECVHYLTDDAIYSCGEAVERAVAETDLAPAWVFTVLRHVPGYSFARERGYRLVADNRSTVSAFIRN